MTDHVLFPFIGQEIGGSHVSAFTLAQSLIRDFGHRCTVIARAGSPIADEATAMGLGLLAMQERTAGRHNPIYDAAHVLPRMSCLRSLGPAIVHTNDIASLQSWLIPARLRRMPVIYHHRALNRAVLPNTVLIRAADHVITISEETRRSVDYLDPAKASVVTDPFAIDRSVERGPARDWLIAELGLPADALIVGFVGNFWRRKRPDFFIAAAASMAGQEPRAQFVFFGRDGEVTTTELRQVAAEVGLAAKVHFPGFRLPVERNLAALDLLLMPAIREPFGRTPIEAALLGTPYVATDDAGHSEIGRRWQGGRLVPKDADAESFAAAALAVLRDPGSVLLSSAQRDAVEADVSPPRHAERVIAVYEALRRRRDLKSIRATSAS